MSMLHNPCLARSLAKSAVIAVLVGAGLIPGLVHADNVTPPTVPTDIQVGAGNVPFLVGHATGTQNYTCQQNSSGYGWTLVAPSATLVDDKGKQIATHYAGPTWRAKDGSSVKGARVAYATVSTSAIDWLLLRATTPMVGTDGGDRLLATSYIQRVNTTGGLAPATGCGASNLGAALNVPYSADYYFYRAQ
jgi:Protein of unknown function (DUF3455)